MVEYLVGTWAFSAHDLTDDELLYGALVMLKHALQMPELGKWVIAEGKSGTHPRYIAIVH